jgi:endonuclease/exonuclease/phosphatase family metal-dependent hydrolase
MDLTMLLRPKFSLLLLLSFGALLSQPVLARAFTVAVYNVENLMDADGVAVYSEYQPSEYTPAHLHTKLTNIAEVVSRLGEPGKGPDILILEEVEVDQTPNAADARTQLKAVEGKTVADLLQGKLSKEAADLSAEAWLLKAVEEKGLRGYNVVVGSDSPTKPYEDGNRRSIKNVVFTRFPVKAVRNHPVLDARNILEVIVDIDGHMLAVFANHWKSGAGSAKTEPVRVADAKVLRRRLDEILSVDPQADIIIGGDFNSQYNQSQRYPGMGTTGMNDILRSQGDELALRTPKADLYNLWYELPNDQRGSDVFDGEWGTLIQLLISRGLYDYKDIQYVDGSFSVAKFPGLNEGGDGLPIRWSSKGPAGSGFSDHFPVQARFITVEDNNRARWLELKNPSDGFTPSKPVETTKAAHALVDPRKEAVSAPDSANIKDGSFTGKIILVEGLAQGGKRLAVQFRGEEWEVYAPGSELRSHLREFWKDGAKVSFYGEVGQYRGRWQFVIRDNSWILR